MASRINMLPSFPEIGAERANRLRRRYADRDHDFSSNSALNVDLSPNLNDRLLDTLR